MSGNLLPLFLNPVQGNGPTGNPQIGGSDAASGANPIFGALLNKALAARSIGGAAGPVAGAVLGASALGGSDGLSALGSQLVQKLAASFHTDASGLQTQFETLLANGQSLASIISKLASSLASQVADALSNDAGGDVGGLARTRILQAFTSALSPPGTGPPNAAAKAAALAQRVVHVANAITAGAAGSLEEGQQYRYPGSSLDAVTAKANPAPTGKDDPTATAAASALTASISANLASALPAPADSPSNTTHSNGLPSLQERIAALLAGGTPPAAIVQTLSNTLGNQVAQRIEADDHTRSRLQLAFGQALQPAVSGPPDQIAAQITAQTTRLVQQSAAEITGGATAGQAVTAFQPAFANATGGGTDVLQRILQRAHNVAAAASSSTLQAGGPLSGTAVLATGSGSQGSASALFGQTPSPANLIATPGAAAAADAFLAKFVQAQTREREANAAAGGLPLTAPSSPTQAFLASIGATGDLPQGAPVSSGTEAALSYTRTDPNNVVEQVLQGILLRSNGTSTEMRMRLVPANLGDVHVKLNVDSASGAVNATLIAHSAEARDALIANQAQLSRSLADAGLKLTQFSVDLSSGGGQSHAFAQQQQPVFFRSSRGRGTDGSADDAVEDGVQAAVPTFGPPSLLSALNHGLLNTLV